MATQHQTFRVRGRYVGHTDIHKPATFLVPVGEIKPLNATPHKFPARLACKETVPLEHGRVYDLVIRRVPNGEWEVLDYCEAA